MIPGKQSDIRTKPRWRKWPATEKVVWFLLFPQAQFLFRNPVSLLTKVRIKTEENYKIVKLFYNTKCLNAKMERT